MAPIVVEMVDLTKTYGDFVAVDRLNLSVEEGEVFGFLGPNGAGKTTTILMLLGLTEPTSGYARVCGYDPPREALKVKRITGYLPENVGFYSDLTARQNLRYTAKLNGMSDAEALRNIEESLEAVELTSVGDQAVGEFSRGMRQRLGIADVLLKEPRVVFMDEPTLGIDPDGANRILDLIQGMARDRKVTVFLSSHLLHQVQRICHCVGIISKGKMVGVGPVAQLRGEAMEWAPVTVEVQASGAGPALMESICGIGGVMDVDRAGDLLLVSCERDARPEISKAVSESGGLLLHMKMRDYGLEEIYLRYFQEG
ncbi:ABC transporter ATP-binding protein [Chloroflexota bacterium]